MNHAKSANLIWNLIYQNNITVAQYSAIPDCLIQQLNLIKDLEGKQMSGMYLILNLIENLPSKREGLLKYYKDHLPSVSSFPQELEQ